MKSIIIVNARWDEESSVWVASSSDIDGLSLEASTLEILMDKIPGALHDLLEMNGLYDEANLPSIPYHLMASRVGIIPDRCS